MLSDIALKKNLSSYLQFVFLFPAWRTTGQKQTLQMFNFVISESLDVMYVIKYKIVWSSLIFRAHSG